VRRILVTGMSHEIDGRRPIGDVVETLVAIGRGEGA
jgi:hypothetical protein